MGLLIHGGVEVEFDDRTLAHLEIVIVTRFRRGESLVVSWLESPAVGSGRSAIWMTPNQPGLLQVRRNASPDDRRGVDQGVDRLSRQLHRPDRDRPRGEADQGGSLPPPPWISRNTVATDISSVRLRGWLNSGRSSSPSGAVGAGPYAAAVMPLGSHQRIAPRTGTGAVGEGLLLIGDRDEGGHEDLLTRGCAPRYSIQKFGRLHRVPRFVFVPRRSARPKRRIRHGRHCVNAEGGSAARARAVGSARSGPCTPHKRRLRRMRPKASSGVVTEGGPAYWLGAHFARMADDRGGGSLRAVVEDLERAEVAVPAQQQPEQPEQPVTVTFPRYARRDRAHRCSAGRERQRRQIRAVAPVVVRVTSTTEQADADAGWRRAMGWLRFDGARRLRDSSAEPCADHDRPVDTPEGELHDFPARPAGGRQWPLPACLHPDSDLYFTFAGPGSRRSPGLARHPEHEREELAGWWSALRYVGGHLLSSTTAASRLVSLGTAQLGSGPAVLAKRRRCQRDSTSSGSRC